MLTKEIPIAQGLPLFGNFFELLSDQPYDFFVQTYQKLGSVYRAIVLGYDLTVMGGSEANIFLAQNGSNYLSNREVFADMEKEFRPGLIIALDGEYHRRSRKIIEKFMYSERVAQYVKPMSLATLDCIKEWQLGQRLEVTAFIRRLICQQTGLALLNVSPEKHFEDIAEFFDILVRATATGYKHFFKWLLSSPTYLIAKKRVFTFIQNIIDERKKTGSVKEHPDMLDTLLTMTHDDGQPLTEDEIFIYTIAPFLVGIDTSANTASFMLYEILKNQKLQEQVMVEVSTAFANGIPDIEVIKKMKILRFALMETLRMYPVGFMLQRYVKNEFDFAGYKIQKGKSIFIAPGISHFLPEFFPNPYKFDVERYDTPRQEHKQPGAYAPFSVGPHSCAGARLAEIQVMLTIGIILYTLQPQLDPPTYCMKTTLFSNKSAMLIPKGDFYIKTKRRSPLIFN